MQELPEASLKPLSIIVCARNEADNLKENLPSLFGQDYPNFEVVVVNDRSWDETEDLLKEFAKEYKFSDIINDLPFNLTNAQIRVLQEIENDMEKDKSNPLERY